MLKLGQSAHGIFAKIILLLLVGTFVLWGIGDVFRQGGGASSVATVGRTPISIQAYQDSLHRRQEELRQMLGKNYTPDLLKTLDIHGQVLMGLVNTLLIEKETEALGIVVGDEQIRDTIRNNPSFADRQGHFDKGLYLETLKDNGIAEQRYVADLRHSIAAKLLTDTMTSGVIVPEVLVDAIYKSRDEQRVADLLILPAGATGVVAAPTDKEIQAYYDQHDKAYLAPERRTVSYVILKLADVAAKIEVPAEELKRVYAEHAQDYRKPEGRIVEQMLFDKEDDARNAANAIAKGKAFAKVADAAPLINKGKLSMGTVSKQEVPAEASDAIFSLKENGVTAPIKTDFGWHIFHVTKFVPESAIPFETAKADIAKDIAAKQAQDSIYKLVNDLEDTLAGGSTLENAAEKIGQKVYTIGPVTREAAEAQSRKQSLPDNLVNVAFSTNEKDHSQATQTNDGSYFLVHVDSVEPEHERPLAEVKDQVTTALKKENKDAQLQKVAEDVSVQLRAGKKLSEVLASHHLELGTTSSGKLKRSSETATAGTLANKPLPREMVLELFRLKHGESTHAYQMADGDAIIASLSQVIAAPDANSKAADAKTLDSIRTELKGQMTNEILRHYIAQLSTKYHVSVNQAALGIKDEESSE